MTTKKIEKIFELCINNDEMENSKNYQKARKNVDNLISNLKGTDKFFQAENSITGFEYEVCKQGFVYGFKYAMGLAKECGLK